MRWSLLFVCAITTLEFAAGISYACQRQWKLAGVWFFVAVANVFMALLDGEK